MKRVFRSILNIKNKEGKATIPQGELVVNYRAFQKSEVKPEEPAHITLYHWIESHFRQYHEVPSVELIYERAHSEGDEALLVAIKEIVEQVPHIRSDFVAVLTEVFERQNKEKFSEVLQKTWQIASSGLKVGKHELKGMKDALKYVIGETKFFRARTSGVKTESQILSVPEANEVKADYILRSKNPMLSAGMWSMINNIDYSLKGLKPGELMIVAAFTGHGKSTMSVNLAYNAVWQDMNGLYISLEMTHKEIKDQIYFLHTSNPIWKKHPKYKHLVGKIPFEKYKYGGLTAEEDEFVLAAIDDFGSREGWGKLKIIQPTETMTPSVLEMEVENYATELREQGREIDWLLVDYVGLMSPDKNERYGDFNIDLNGIIKRLKNYALTYNEGKGLRVITPFQINREGLKEASKADGVLSLTALSSANEAERSSDIVIGLYMTREMARQGLMKICCMKLRRGVPFAPFEAFVDWVSMRIREAVQTKEQVPESPMGVEEINTSPQIVKG